MFALIATQARKTHQRLAFLHVSKIPLCTYTVYIYFHIFKYMLNCMNILIIDLTWLTIHNILRLMSIINGLQACTISLSSSYSFTSTFVLLFPGYFITSSDCSKSCVVLLSAVLNLECLLYLLGSSWSYGSWIYNYLYNQCLLSRKLWVRMSLMARCTRDNLVW